MENAATSSIQASHAVELAREGVREGSRALTLAQQANIVMVLVVMLFAGSFPVPRTGRREGAPYGTAQLSHQCGQS